MLELFEEFELEELEFVELEPADPEDVPAERDDPEPDEAFDPLLV